MNTTTKLVMTPAQARDMIAKLQRCVDWVESQGEPAYDTRTLEQMPQGDEGGPWRLVLGVLPAQQMPNV